MDKEFTYTDFFFEIVDIAIYSFIEQFPAKRYPYYYNFDGTLNDKSREFITQRFNFIFNGRLNDFDYKSVEKIAKRMEYIKKM